MSTIKSSNEHLTLNADGSGKDIKFQSNGSEVASISDGGVVTATSYAGSGANLTGISSVGGATGVDFNDNVKARFGTGNDLEIYHNGTQSILYDASDINLETETNILMKRQSGGGATMFKAVVDGAVELYHDNTKKFETTATGINLYPNTNTRRFTNRIYNEGTDDSNVWSSYHSGNGNIREVGMEGSKVRFYTGAESGTSTTQRVEISIDGHIVIGGNSAASNLQGSDSELTLYNNSDFYTISNNSRATASSERQTFRSAGTQVGAISAGGSSTSYGTSSDYRLKENVDYTWDATTRLKQLKPARFNWIADETNTLVDGFIAHEVENIVPEAVFGTKDAVTAEVLYVEGDELPEGKSVGDVKIASAIKSQQIDQSKLVPLLVKTIQELEARITALEA